MIGIFSGTNMIKIWNWFKAIRSFVRKIKEKKTIISRNYYIQINETWYYINVYTTIKGYLAVA
jgi:hypothetical protein